VRNYEIIITLVANRKPKLDELHDFLFCRMRDGDLKYKIIKVDNEQKEKTTNNIRTQS